MANSEHLNVLSQGVAAWNLWRTANPDILPDLTRASLARADLHGINFSESDLTSSDLREADLSSASLIKANLTSANLANSRLLRAKFDHSRLFEADLSASTLTGAGFTRADLTKADLTNADLSDAWLSGVGFSWSILSGVKLSGASLAFAILRNTLLQGTDFSECLLFGAVFAGVDLGAARGLERVRHLGPSELGLQTFLMSNGKIPDAFLRGCGWPDCFIQSGKALVSQPHDFYSVFISYSHSERTFARSLYERLQTEGVRCYLDEHQILPGDDVHDAVDVGIRDWDKLILCASKASLTSWWVDSEISRAFQKEARIMKERAKKVHVLIPLNLDGFLLAAEYQSGKKAEITSRLAADFVGWDMDPQVFDRELKKLVRALRADSGGRETPPAPKI